MDSQRFEQLVIQAIESLPDELRDRMENIDIVIADQPSPHQVEYSDRNKGELLLGLHEGVPLTDRSGFYGMVAPDKITIFQKPIEDKCRNDDEITAEVQRVVQHEIAHHFGIGEARLRQIERDKYGRKGRTQN